MGYSLESLARDGGLSYATHIWNTTVASFALIAAPSAGKSIRLRYISTGASALGTSNTRLTTGTTAATTYWQYPLTLPIVEDAFIDLDDGVGASLFAGQGTGNGFIRVYYSINRTSGTRE